MHTRIWHMNLLLVEVPLDICEVIKYVLLFDGVVFICKQCSIQFLPPLAFRPPATQLVA